MTLIKGDHLVIKRNTKILTEQDEAYHEFEVLDYACLTVSSPDNKTLFMVLLKVVK